MASSKSSGKATHSPESFDSLFRRNAAAEILQSYEKLSWYSFQRCESLAQTRLHFQNIVAGFTEQDEASLVDWIEDRTPRPKPGEEASSVRKGKERISLASAGGGDGEVGSSAQKGDRHGDKNAGAGSTSSSTRKRKSGGG